MWGKFMVIFILLTMLFCHVIDDFYLQGILASMKQKMWWRKQEQYKEKYKYDYIPSLIIHAFSWVFMIMLPVAIYLKFNLGWLYLAYPVNLIIHAVVDDLKANKLKINLVVDQSIHICQILITWALFYIFYF